MKKKRKFNRLLLTSGLVLVSSSMLLGTLTNVSPLDSILQVQAAPINDEYDWYTLKADDTEDVYSLEFLLSPLPRDYKRINKDSVNAFFNDVVEGAKNIAMAQMNFLSEVPVPPQKEIDESIVPDESSPGQEGTFNKRQTLLGKLVKDILEGEENSQNRIDYEDAIENDEPISPEDFDQSSSGVFLKSLLTYMATYSVGQVSENEEDIATKLGVEVDPVSGEVTPKMSGGEYVGELAQNLATAYGFGSEELVATALSTMYEDALEIKNDETIKCEALIQIFDALEDTQVSVDTVVQILGPENTLETVMEIFTNEDVSVTAGVHFLNELTNRTMGDLCDSIQDNLIAEGKEGFTIQDIKDAFEASSNAKLMSIFNELDTNGLNNIRIILGKPVDYEAEGDTPEKVKRVTRATSHDHHAPASDYASASADLVQIIMERLTLNDLLTGTKYLDIIYQGPRDDAEHQYVLFDRPTDEFGNENDSLQFRTHAFVDFLHALPTMNDIKNLPDGQHFVEFQMNLKTVFNPMDPDHEGELTPIVYNVKVGFQNKDTSLIRRLAKILDDTFDLDFGYDYEGDQTFWIDLKARNPEFVSNLYGWLIDSGVIKNNNGLLVELWDVLFSSFRDIKDYIKAKTAEDIASMLKDIDYETAFDLLTTQEKLNEIFGDGKITTSQVQRALDLLKKVIDKAEDVSFDDILGYFPEAFSSIADLLNKESIRNLYENIQELLKKIDTSKFTIEEIQAITNGEIYDRISPDMTGMNYVIKIKNKLMSFIDRLPDHMLDKSLLDYYVGNGEFDGSLEFALTDSRYEKVLKAIPGFGSDLWTLFDGMVTGKERPAKLQVSLNAKFNDIHKITYEWEEDGVAKSKSGLLFTGSDVKLISGLSSLSTSKSLSMPTGVWHWLDKSASSYTIADKMVAKDVVVIPEYICTLNEISGVSRVYNPSQTDTLSMQVSGEYVDNHTKTYVWEKFDEESEEYVEFATTKDITVTDVSDSGIYKYTVIFDKDVVGSEVALSGFVEVNITKAPINLGTPTWSSDVTYNGSAQQAVITSMENKEYVSITYDNNEHVDAGSYAVVANYTLLPAYEDNYVLSKTSDNHTFNIFKQILNVESIVWDYSGEAFSYDGHTHQVNVTSYTNSDKIDVSITGNSATNAGEYTANASFSIKEEYANNYALGTVSEQKSLNWKISAEPTLRYYDFISKEVDDSLNHNAIIHVDDGFLENPDFHAVKNDGSSFEGIEFDSKELFIAPGEIVHGYDLSFDIEGTPYPMSDSKVKISILIPEEIRNGDFQIVTLNEDNEVVKVNATLSKDGKYAEITGDYISKIGFITAIKPSILIKDNPQASILFGCLIITQILFMYATVRVSKKFKKKINHIREIFED